jgi:hypothetical protein
VELRKETDDAGGESRRMPGLPEAQASQLQLDDRVVFENRGELLQAETLLQA